MGTAEIVIPAKEVKEWIDSIITSEFKTDKFKWVMKNNMTVREEYQMIGDLKITLEEDNGQARVSK